MSITPDAMGPSTPTDFARACFESVDRAWQESGGRVQDFDLGAVRLRVRYLGDGVFAQLSLALSHLRTHSATASPLLNVDVWDGATTTARMPAAYWPIADYNMRGEVRGFEEAGVMARYDLGSETFQLYDHHTKRGLYTVDGVERLPYWEKSFPLRLMLHWALRDSPWQPLHAGAVGLSNGGLLIAGPSGSGKSSSCVSCLGSRLKFLGDDYVLAGATSVPQIQTLYHWAKLERDGLERLPWLKDKLRNPAALTVEKAVVEVGKHFPSELLKQTPLRAIVLPRVTGAAKHRLAPVSRAQALRALAPTTLLQLPGNSARTLAKMRTLCADVPAYEMLLGASPPKDIPLMLLELLESLDVRD